jgi:hypothetical protein
LQENIPSRKPVYTSFMADMIDDINQRTDPRYGNGNSNYPIDNVSGYTMREVENMVMNNATFSGLKDDMKRVYSNPTEIYLDELRNQW